MPLADGVMVDFQLRGHSDNIIASSRVTMDCSEIWAGELHVKGLDLTNESTLVGGANIGEHSIEISEITVNNSYLHLSASNDRTQSGENSDAQSMTLKSIVASGDNTRITFSARRRPARSTRHTSQASGRM